MLFDEVQDVLMRSWWRCSCAASSLPGRVDSVRCSSFTKAGHKSLFKIYLKAVRGLAGMDETHAVQPIARAIGKRRNGFNRPARRNLPEGSE